MRIFLTGATGHPGAVTLERLVAAGHHVEALARPAHAPRLRPRDGVSWIVGDFSATELIHEVVSTTDATIHIGASHDDQMEQLDAGVIDAVADAYDGSGKAFVTTSAAPVYGDTGLEPRTEEPPIENPHPLRAWRERHDRRVVGLSSRGIRGVAIRPGYIYGHAQGFLAGQVIRAQRTGKALYIGEGTNLTSTVHADALADLYVRAVENERAAGVYNAASDDLVCGRDTAHLIAELYGPGIVAESWPLEAARQTLGELADLSCVNCVLSSAKARCELDWDPCGPSLTTELATGTYRTQPLNSRYA